MNTTKVPVTSIDLRIRHREYAVTLRRASTQVLFERAQALRDLWARDIVPNDIQVLTVEVEWEGGASFAAEMHLAHPSRAQPIEERDIAAHVVGYLRYCAGEMEVWPPTVGMLEEIVRKDPGMFMHPPAEIARRMDFRNEQKRAWAQAFLDRCELPEVAA